MLTIMHGVHNKLKINYMSFAHIPHASIIDNMNTNELVYKYTSLASTDSLLQIYTMLFTHSLTTAIHHAH